MKRALLLFVFALVALPACARRVVLAPNDVPRQNDSQWRVTSEPAPAATTTPIDGN